MATSKDSDKSTLYIGGLDHQVTSQVLHAAFIPFGDITLIEIPPDPTSTAPHRGFGFVEFDLPADAEAAKDNMHLSELFGKTIKVNLAKPQKGGRKGGPERGIWASEEYLQENNAMADQDQDHDMDQGSSTSLPSSASRSAIGPSVSM